MEGDLVLDLELWSGLEQYQADWGQGWPAQEEEMMEKHPDYEDVYCSACNLLIQRNGEDDHNECVLILSRQNDDLRTQLEKARRTARRSYRCAGHLAIMHRRENRVMEGAEGELEAIRREAGEWLTEQKATDE